MTILGWFISSCKWGIQSGYRCRPDSHCALNADEIEQLYVDDFDGDGVQSWEDCDDTDPSIPTIDDQDCDGYTVVDGDCDDADATGFHLLVIRMEMELIQIATTLIAKGGISERRSLLRAQL